MAKAYLCADIVVTDREAYLKYRDQVPATIAAYGGRYLARGGDRKWSKTPVLAASFAA